MVSHHLVSVLTRDEKQMPILATTVSHQVHPASKWDRIGQQDALTEGESSSHQMLTKRECNGQVPDSHQVHQASKWDRVSGQVPHFQQHNSPSHLGQVQYQKDPYRGEECTSMVSHSGLVRHQKDPCRCEETSQQQ